MVSIWYKDLVTLRTLFVITPVLTLTLVSVILRRSLILGNLSLWRILILRLVWWLQILDSNDVYIRVV